MNEKELQSTAQALRLLTVEFLDNLFTVWDKPGSIANMESSVISKFRTVGMKLRAKNRLVETKLQSQLNTSDNKWVTERHFNCDTPKVNGGDFYDLTSSPFCSQEPTSQLDLRSDSEDLAPKFQPKLSANKVTSSPSLPAPSRTVLPPPMAGSSSHPSSSRDDFGYDEAIDWQDSPPSDYEDQSATPRAAPQFSTQRAAPPVPQARRQTKGRSFSQYLHLSVLKT